MILRKTYNITDWKNWDRQLDSSAKEFYELTGKWPNILLANDPTLGRIDFLANQARENIFREGPTEMKVDPKDNNEWRELCGFQGPSYAIGFCIDPHLANGAFSLIYDADPDGDGGEPVPEMDNVKIEERKIKRKRKAS
jgi:hypothetical protein